jgi:hypothetical protein
MNHPALVTVDVFENFGDFLGALVAWIKGRRRSQALRTSLASEVIRNEEGARKVWVGVGVYTVCEIFFLAGVWFLITSLVPARLNDTFQGYPCS